MADAQDDASRVAARISELAGCCRAEQCPGGQPCTLADVPASWAGGYRKALAKSSGLYAAGKLADLWVSTAVGNGSSAYLPANVSIAEVARLYLRKRIHQQTGGRHSLAEGTAPLGCFAGT